MGLEFVNLNGDRVSVNCSTPGKQVRKQGPDEYHKGFRVMGIPPGAFEAAKAEREKAIRLANETGVKPLKPLEYESWASGPGAAKAVRSKPYELREAARQCQELATQAGWDRVHIVEIKKIAQPA